MLDLKFVGIANECVNPVSAIKRLLDDLTPRRTRCAKYENLHGFNSIPLLRRRRRLSFNISFPAATTAFAP